MNLNRLMYSKYSCLTTSDEKIKLEHMSSCQAVHTPSHSPFLPYKVWGWITEQDKSGVLYRAATGKIKKKTEKMVFIIIKRTRGDGEWKKHNEKTEGWNEARKTYKQFTFVLREKKRLGGGKMHMEMWGEHERKGSKWGAEYHVAALMQSALSANEHPNDTLLKGSSTEWKKWENTLHFLHLLWYKLAYRQHRGGAAVSSLNLHV